MPYCPKCDMEFVEGIKVCSDCGGPLVESKEVAEAMKKKEQEEQLAAMAQEMDPFSGEGTDTEFSGDNPPEKSSPAAEPVHAYVDKGQRYDDMSSSASAFFLVGGYLPSARHSAFWEFSISQWQGSRNICLRAFSLFSPSAALSLQSPQGSALPS